VAPIVKIETIDVTSSFGDIKATPSSSLLIEKYVDKAKRARARIYNYSRNIKAHMFGNGNSLFLAM